MLTYYSDKHLNFLEIKTCEGDVHAEKEHFHSEVSIALVESAGKYVTSDNKTEHIFKNNSLILIPPLRPHKCVPTNSENFKFHLMYIKSDWFEKVFNIKLNNSKLKFYEINIDDSNKIKNIFRLLKSEILPIEKEFLLIKFIENYILQKSLIQYSEEHFNSIKRNKLELIRKYLKSNYEKKISLDDLSKISGLSKYHLMRSFKNEFRMSPLNYQKNIKFNQAKKFLRNSKDEISEIALKLGYYDQSHFTNEFKKFSGVSPNHYKKSLQK